MAKQAFYWWISPWKKIPSIIYRVYELAPLSSTLHTIQIFEALKRYALPPSLFHHSHKPCVGGEVPKGTSLLRLADALREMTEVPEIVTPKYFGRYRKGLSCEHIGFSPRYEREYRSVSAKHPLDLVKDFSGRSRVRSSNRIYLRNPRSDENSTPFIIPAAGEIKEDVQVSHAQKKHA